MAARPSFGSSGPILTSSLRASWGPIVDIIVRASQISPFRRTSYFVMKCCCLGISCWAMATLAGDSAMAQEWRLRHTIIPEEGMNTSGPRNFGRRSIHGIVAGNRAVVGDDGDDRFCPNTDPCNSGALYLFDTLTGEQLPTVLADAPRRLGFFGGSAKFNGDVAVTNHGDTSMQFLDVGNGELLHELTRSDLDLREMRLPLGGNAINSAVVALQGTSRSGQDELRFPVFVDLQTGEERFRIRDDSDWGSIAVAVNESTGLVTRLPGTNDGVLIDLNSGNEIGELSAPESWESFVWPGINEEHAFLTADGETIVFDLETQKEINRYDTPHSRSAHDGEYIFTRTNHQIGASCMSVDFAILEAHSGSEVFSRTYESLHSSNCTNGLGINGNTAIGVLVNGDDPEGNPAGAVLVFQYGNEVLGDFSDNGVLDAADIDELAAEVAAGNFALHHDINNDGVLSFLDQTAWVNRLAGTSFGDANLDGEVNFDDFVSLSTNFRQNGGWAAGDFDGSGGVGFADFVLLSTNFGKANTAIATVPEPQGVSTLCGIALLIVSRSRRRQLLINSVERDDCNR